MALNPDILDSLFVGDQVLVTQSRDYLPVQVWEHKVYTEEIPFQTVTTESGDYSWGTMKVVQEGSNGLKQIESDFYYIDGVLQQEVVLNETVLQEAVSKEVIKGTRRPDGSIGQLGSGIFSWPVPSSYRPQPRLRRSHYGLDILSYYGAPIYAADSGVVTTARQRAGALELRHLRAHQPRQWLPDHVRPHVRRGGQRGQSVKRAS